MSKSSITLSLNFHMLDKHPGCDVGFEDSSGGHKLFTSGRVKLRCRPASASLVQLSDFDLEAHVRVVVEDIKRELEFDREHGDVMLMSLVRSCLTKAKQHCDEVHVQNTEANK